VDEKIEFYFATSISKILKELVYKNFDPDFEYWQEGLGHALHFFLNEKWHRCILGIYFVKGNSNIKKCSFLISAKCDSKFVKANSYLRISK
jgi:hypothetical protein